MHLCLKKLTSKYGKRIVLIYLYALYKAQRMSESSLSYLFVAVFPFLVMKRIS